MNPRSFLILVAITTVSVVLATITVIGESSRRGTVGVGAEAFPGLVDRANDLARLTITTPEETFTIERDGDGWAMAERAGYPAKADVVSSVVAGLASLRLLEAKTFDPERYARLQVDDPGAEGARSRLVRLEDADGDVLAEAILGRENFAMSRAVVGTGRGGLYLRKPDEALSWLAEGAVELPRSMRGWLDTVIVNLPRSDIASIAYLDAEGAVIARLGRPMAEEEALDLVEPATGRTAKGDVMDRVPAILSSMTFDDVVRAEDRSEGAEPRTTVVETVDGLTITVASTREGEHTWATFEVAAGDEADEAIRTEAEALSEKVSGWSYRVPPFKSDLLRFDLDDLSVPSPDAGGDG